MVLKIELFRALGSSRELPVRRHGFQLLRQTEFYYRLDDALWNDLGRKAIFRGMPIIQNPKLSTNRHE